MANAKNTRGYGVLTTAFFATLLVATGRPEPETLEAVIGFGVPAAAANAALYAAPVVLMVAAMAVGRAVASGRAPAVRWAIYAGLGAVAGFVLGLCLELFAGASDILARFVGPLAAPTLLDTFLWVLAGLGAALGLLLGAIAAFGRPAVSALQVEAADPECIDVRRSERAMFGWSAAGMATLGLSCAALAVARQAGEQDRAGPVIVALLAGAASAYASFVLWRGFDEMQRRHVVEGYAASAIAATLGAFLWAAAQALGLVPAVDATGVFLVLISVQLIATSYVAGSVMGQNAARGRGR